MTQKGQACPQLSPTGQSPGRPRSLARPAHRFFPKKPILWVPGVNSPGFKILATEFNMLWNTAEVKCLLQVQTLGVVLPSSQWAMEPSG